MVSIKPPPSWEVVALLLALPVLAWALI